MLVIPAQAGIQISAVNVRKRRIVLTSLPLLGDRLDSRLHGNDGGRQSTTIRDHNTSPYGDLVQRSRQLPAEFTCQFRGRTEHVEDLDHRCLGFVAGFTKVLLDDFQADFQRLAML